MNCVTSFCANGLESGAVLTVPAPTIGACLRSAKAPVTQPPVTQPPVTQAPRGQAAAKPALGMPALRT